MVRALLGAAPRLTAQGRAFPVETRWLDRPLPAGGRLADDAARLIARAHDETRETGGVCDGNNLAAAGLPVIDTTAVEEGEFLVGNFQMAAMLWDREDAVVDISTEDRDNFIKNMVTIRAEERLALTVYRPSA